ncbi:MAG: penicillin-binding protein activator [Bradymonadaceae bacterium]
MLLLLVFLSSCASITRQRGVPLEEQSPIRAASPEAQARFDAALTDLEEGRYTEAAESLRLIQAEFPDDAIATLAELYIGRASMGKVWWSVDAGDEEAPAYAGNDDALRLFAALMRDRDIDGRIRYGAQTYYALELALRGQIEEGLLALKDYPSPSPSPVVLDSDRPHILPLISESLYRAGRGADALEALGRLFDSVHTEHDSLDQEPALEEGSAEVEAFPTTQVSLVAYARGRSFEIAESLLSEVEQHELLTSASPLLRAATAWGIIGAALAGEPEEEEREAMIDLFNTVASDFVRIDAAERAAELSLRLASIGGPRRLVIGALLPLTGPNRVVGRKALAGMLVAQSAFHHHGRPEVTLVFQDSHGDVVAAFEALRGQGVSAIIGPLDAKRSRQVADAARDHGIPIISLAADRLAADEDTQAPLLFRNFIQASAEARAMAKIAFEELENRRAAVIYPDIGYGRTMSEAFSRAFRELGGQIVVETSYDRTSSDFAGLARRVAEVKPDAIFIPDTAGKVAELTAFLAQENIWGHAPVKRQSARAQRTFVHYLGTSLWHDPTLLRQAASYIDGALVPAWFSPTFNNALGHDFHRRFEAIYGRSPQDFEAFAYDSVALLRHLMADRGLERPEAIREALSARNAREGVTGTYYFDARGEPSRGLRFLQVSGSEWAVFGRTYQTGEVYPASASSETPQQP